jgi:hypothetical protein
MALNKKSVSARRSEPGKSENWGQLLGGTDFLIARTGGDFTVPIRKAAWCGREVLYGDGNLDGRTKRECEVATMNTNEIGQSFKKVGIFFKRKKMLGKFRQTENIQVSSRIVHQTMSQ